MRPGHMQLRVLDLEGVNHYKNVLGLVETGRDAQGRVYFKAWDERDHNSLILREADRPAWISSPSRLPTRPPSKSSMPT
jgi:catechol 2,3-dioxygenase